MAKKIKSSNFIHVHSFIFRKLCSHTGGLLLHNAFPLCLDISKITENQEYFGINKNKKKKGNKIHLWRKREQKTSILLNFWNICAIKFRVSMWKIESLSFPVCETVPHFVFQPRRSYALKFEIRKDPWQNAWGFFTVSALQAEHEFELGLGLIRDIVLSRLKKWEQPNSAWV